MAVDLRRIGEEDVFGLQVAMNDALRVEILQTANHLASDNARFVLANGVALAVAIDERPQITARRKFGEGIPVNYQS